MSLFNLHQKQYTSLYQFTHSISYSLHPTYSLPVLPVQPPCSEAGFTSQDYMLNSSPPGSDRSRLSGSIGGAAAVTPPPVHSPLESAAALTGGEYLCRWSLPGFDVCLWVEREGRAKQKVKVLPELQS